MIQFICFSRNRPLQLHGYLTSFYEFMYKCSQSQVTMTVVAKVDKAYEQAYQQLATEFKDVRFIWETNFHDDLISAFNTNPYVCFGCDDVVFTAPFRTVEILEAFDDETFAFSLRLGLNIKESMFSGKMTLPDFLSKDRIMSWDLHKSHHCGDWGYSWELNGTVYPADIAKKVIEEVKANSPNILENSGGGKWSKMTKRHLMKSWTTSRLSVPTVNVVQTNYANPICGSKELSPEFLLQCWNSGLRLDFRSFANDNYNSVHVPSFYLRRV